VRPDDSKAACFCASGGQSADWDVSGSAAIEFLLPSAHDEKENRIQQNGNPANADLNGRIIVEVSEEAAKCGQS
jgi:hypothetical protein